MYNTKIKIASNKILLKSIIFINFCFSDKELISIEDAFDSFPIDSEIKIYNHQKKIIVFLAEVIRKFNTLLNCSDEIKNAIELVLQSIQTEKLDYIDRIHSSLEKVDQLIDCTVIEKYEWNDNCKTIKIKSLNEFKHNSKTFSNNLIKELELIKALEKINENKVIDKNITYEKNKLSYLEIFFRKKLSTINTLINLYQNFFYDIQFIIQFINIEDLTFDNRYNSFLYKINLENINNFFDQYSNDKREKENNKTQNEKQKKEHSEFIEFIKESNLQDKKSKI